VVLWYTGLSGSGKSTVANAVDRKLYDLGVKSYVLDGDNVRHGLNGDLSFSDVDRVENIRRVGEVAKLFVDAGVLVSTAFISPFSADRALVRQLLQEGQFLEVFIDTPLEVCEQRDTKGLYKKARTGEIKNFTGIDSAYEAPTQPEILVTTAGKSVEECADFVISQLKQREVI
jgi:adenylylsulfate kinase